MLDIAAGCDSRYIGMGALIGSLPQRDLELLLTMGPDGGRNPGTKWYDREENLLVWSEDLSQWTSLDTPIVTATTVEDDSNAHYEGVRQTVAAPDATTYTRTVWVLKDAVVPATRFPWFRTIVSGTYNVRLDTSSGASTEDAGLGAAHTVTSETIEGNEYWKLVMTFTTDDANGIILDIFPAAGANADLTTISLATVGEITVLRQQLTPGSSSGTYRVTEARQRVWDWSGEERHAQVGSGGGITTNDPDDALWRKNLLADGSTEDLQVVWAETGSGSIDDATHFTFAAQNDVVSQDVATVAGVSYTVSFKARAVTGNTALHIYHNDSATGNSTAQVVTATLTRYSVTVLGKVGDGAVSFGIQDQNAGGFGQVELTEWQVEVGALTDYDASDRMVVAARGDFDGVDNYLDIASLALAGDWSFVALFRPDDNTARGLWRDGASKPDVSLDANSKMEYDADSTVTATNAINLGAWNMVAVTKSGTTITHYLNGVANGSGTSAGGDAFSALRIGYDGSAYFDGAMALFAAWSRLLGLGENLAVYSIVKRRWNLDSLNTRRNLTLP